jgi:hypothetical protein
VSRSHRCSGLQYDSCSLNNVHCELLERRGVKENGGIRDTVAEARWISMIFLVYSVLTQEASLIVHVDRCCAAILDQGIMTSLEIRV